MSSFYNKLIQNNKEWVRSNLAKDPDFFNKLKGT
ncbi:MAG: hypothetical protein UZ11_BCD004001434 [Bacteroidetes bacterium OLB11]|nr:MAG: hypothetical protein UZ11_BCD004001434 [Bacteroidetes bacterium OLB11]